MVTVYHHFDSAVENHSLSSADGHGGGDALLCQNFISVMKGESKSTSPLSDGILSAEMCLAAR